MTLELFAALALYAFVSSVTPGPNNLMLLASGVNFGFRRTLPHMLGILIGMQVMIALVGLGLAGLFLAWPPAQQILTALSIAYLAWLAWKIATAAPPSPEAPQAAKPFSFLQAAAFQWVNPKAWTMVLGAVTLYAPAGTPGAVGFVMLAFGLVGLPPIALWAALGTLLRTALLDRRKRRAFNLLMAALLLATLIPVLRH